MKKVLDNVLSVLVVVVIIAVVFFLRFGFATTPERTNPPTWPIASEMIEYPCPWCNGTGHFEVEEEKVFGKERPCGYCNGSGKIPVEALYKMPHEERLVNHAPRAD
jgi:hypothetical protein